MTLHLMRLCLMIMGMTMIMATHQISLIRTLAHEILFMEEGSVVEQGQPDTLLVPGSRSQDFCDKLNFITGERP